MHKRFDLQYGYSAGNQELQVVIAVRPCTVCELHHDDEEEQEKLQCSEAPVSSQETKHVWECHIRVLHVIIIMIYIGQMQHNLTAYTAMLTNNDKPSVCRVRAEMDH